MKLRDDVLIKLVLVESRKITQNQHQSAFTVSYYYCCMTFSCLAGNRSIEVIIKLGLILYFLRCNKF